MPPTCKTVLKSLKLSSLFNRKKKKTRIQSLAFEMLTFKLIFKLIFNYFNLFKSIFRHTNLFLTLIRGRKKPSKMIFETVTKLIPLQIRFLTFKALKKSLF